MNRVLHRVRRYAAAVIASVLVSSGAWGGEPNIVPLPQLPRGPIEMRVAHVINSRLPRIDSAQLDILLAATQKTAREHFGVDIRFTAVDEIPVERLFAGMPALQRAQATNDVYDFKSGHGDPDQLAKAFAKGFRGTGEPLSALIAFSRPYVGELKRNSYAELGIAMSGLQLTRIQRWKNVKALDGGPAIDDKPYNEFAFWNLVGYGDVPYELLVTNQIIASVEHSLPAVHASVRGGYTNGITTYSRSSRFATFSLWSTFAFTTDDPWVTEMRDGETYSRSEAARLAGVGAAHEIGHQLFHFVHPFGQTACVMNPVPLFAYRAWAEKLAGKDCPIGSNAAMTPGAYKFKY